MPAAFAADLPKVMLRLFCRALPNGIRPDVDAAAGAMAIRLAAGSEEQKFADYYLKPRDWLG